MAVAGERIEEFSLEECLLFHDHGLFLCRVSAFQLEIRFRKKAGSQRSSVLTASLFLCPCLYLCLWCRLAEGLQQSQNQDQTSDLWPCVAAFLS